MFDFIHYCLPLPIPTFAKIKHRAELGVLGLSRLGELVCDNAASFSGKYFWDKKQGLGAVTRTQNLSDAVPQWNEDLNEAGSIWDLQQEKQQQLPTKHTDNQKFFLVLIKRERRKQSLWPGPPDFHQNTAALQGQGVGTARSQPQVSLKALFKRNWSQSSYALLKGLFMGAEVVLNSARSKAEVRIGAPAALRAEHPRKGGTGAARLFKNLF